MNTVLQLRLHPQLVALRERLAAEGVDAAHDVCLTYITARGRWYDVSWKGSRRALRRASSTNIGIHFFDLLLWLFGPAWTAAKSTCATERRIGGVLELERARVRWFLSTEVADLPFAAATRRQDHLSIDYGRRRTRSSSAKVSPICTRASTKRCSAGRGFGIEDAGRRSSCRIGSGTRRASQPLSAPHPLARGEAR